MRHAGFAAAIVLGQRVLQDLIRTLYQGGRVPHRLDTDQSFTLESGGTARLEMAFFMEPPTLVCAAGDGHRIRIELRGWGPLAVTVPGEPRAERTVLFRGRVLAVPDLRIAQSELTVDVDPWTAALAEGPSFDVLSGPAFPPSVEAFLRSDEFRTNFERGIRVQLASQQLAPPFNVSFLGGIVRRLPRPTARVLDGALAVGLDLETEGSADQLTDFREGSDLAMWTNPATADLALEDARMTVADLAARRGARLDRFSITFEEGYIRISGAASSDDGSVVFSANAIPRLVRPERREEGEDEDGRPWVIVTPAREELWFEMRDVVVDVHRAAWVVLLEALGAVLAGLGPALVESMVSTLRSQIEFGIRVGGAASQGARTQEISLPDIPEPRIRIRIERFSSHSEGLFTSLTMRPLFWAPALETPSTVDVLDLPWRPLVFRVRLPVGVLTDDPRLRIAWTVRRLDTNQVVVSSDTRAAVAGIDFWFDASTSTAAPAFAVSCRVYRPLGATVNELFEATRTVRVTDRLDRTRPFVRWRHSVYTPNIRVEADGSHTLLGYNNLARVSAIHRTDVPGRCRMVTRYSYQVSSQPDPTGRARALEYLDELPFPRSQLVLRRAELCDYCFFGGPAGTVPLVPT